MGRLFLRLLNAARPWGLDWLMRRVGPPVVRYLAETGVGSDECLKSRVFPARVDFYSPIPDVEDLRLRDVWSRRSAMAGVDWNLERQLNSLRAVTVAHSAECRWPRRRPEGETEGYYVDNGAFGFGCAAAVHCMVRHLKPRRVIEIGSGNSTRVIGAALCRNREEGCPSNYLVIDPFGSPGLERLPGVDEVLRSRVEVVEPGRFGGLDERDILFIDSGHVVRIGGDVNFLYLDVLPTLRPGVVIHAHDIHLPNEYPQTYAENPQFRVFWTEAYLLQAFLCFNQEFEILFSMHALQHDCAAEFAQLFPQFVEFADLPKSGSFWFRRKPAGETQ